MNKETDLQRAQVVILCGGRGTRMLESLERRPKGLMDIGQRPVIWHIMKSFAASGFREFVLTLGYGAEAYREYFYTYGWKNSNFRLRLSTGELTYHRDNDNEIDDWQIDFIDTGADAETAERVLQAERYVTTENFFVSYCDDLADIDFRKLLELHRRLGRIGTLTGVRPESPFGELMVAGDAVTEFVEKPRVNHWINGGYYVFNRRIYPYLRKGNVLEREPLASLAADQQLAVYRHEGFWHAVNTRKDLIALNKLWYSGKSIPWKRWQ